MYTHRPCGQAALLAPPYGSPAAPPPCGLTATLASPASTTTHGPPTTTLATHVRLAPAASRPQPLTPCHRVRLTSSPPAPLSITASPPSCGASPLSNHDVDILVGLCLASSSQPLPRTSHAVAPPPRSRLHALRVGAGAASCARPSPPRAARTSLPPLSATRPTRLRARPPSATPDRPRVTPPPPPHHPSLRTHNHHLRRNHTSSFDTFVPLLRRPPPTTSQLRSRRAIPPLALSSSTPPALVAPFFVVFPSPLHRAVSPPTVPFPSLFTLTTAALARRPSSILFSTTKQALSSPTTTTLHLHHPRTSRALGCSAVEATRVLAHTTRHGRQQYVNGGARANRASSSTCMRRNYLVCGNTTTHSAYVFGLAFLYVARLTRCVGSLALPQPPPAALPTPLHTRPPSAYPSNTHRFPNSPLRLVRRLLTFATPSSALAPFFYSCATTRRPSVFHHLPPSRSPTFSHSPSCVVASLCIYLSQPALTTTHSRPVFVASNCGCARVCVVVERVVGRRRWWWWWWWWWCWWWR